MQRLIYVYGTLKSGRSNHRVMGGSEMLGTHTTEPVYTMKTTGGFPIVERNGATPIQGEVYKVTDQNTLKGIYRLEGCTGEQGNPRNWYDMDTINTPWGVASIFVMDKDKNPSLRVLENGIF